MHMVYVEFCDWLYVYALIEAANKNMTESEFEKYLSSMYYVSLS